jgi:hypothetical protein
VRRRQPAPSRARRRADSASATVVFDREIRFALIGIRRECHPDDATGLVERVFQAVRDELVDDETCRHGAIERKDQSRAHVDLDRDALALRVDVGTQSARR